MLIYFLNPPGPSAHRKIQFYPIINIIVFFGKHQKFNIFSKPTSESIISCEGQSKVKAMEEMDGEYKPNEESYLRSDKNYIVLS